jgi:putative transposase
VAESFFGSLKQERVQWQNYQTRFEAQQKILNYISMFYNSRRQHPYLGYQSPNQYEQSMAKLEKAAYLGCPKIVDHVSMTFPPRLNCFGVAPI